MFYINVGGSYKYACPYWVQCTSYCKRCLIVKQFQYNNIAECADKSYTFSRNCFSSVMYCIEFV